MAEILKPEEVLLKYWGYKSFRPVQREIIESVLSGSDTLALLPTGGGKSLCFQVPAMMKEGVCVVVSPLIALMKDQVDNLKSRNISATYLHGNLNFNEQITILDNCEFGKVKFLYVSPERLQNEVFISRIKEMKVSLIAVDEAHCISQWGYDFRPAYLKIKTLREVLPDVTVIALTASATPGVMDDIASQLDMKKRNVFRASFLRPNLSFVIRNTQDKRNELLHILSTVKGSAIVYAKTRKQTVEVCNWLRRESTDADFYHAGLSHAERHEKQENWSKSNSKVMVCTNAFGMGIDKPDVRIVLHMAQPESLEAYYQEAGRAGRDGKKSFAVLLFSKDDESSFDTAVASYFPSVTELKDFYDDLLGSNGIAFHSGKDDKFDFQLVEYCAAKKMHPQKISNMLNAMEYHDLLTYQDSVFERPKVKIAVSNITLSAYITEHKSTEALLKLLIRTSPGIFEFPVTVNESVIAKKLNLSVEKLNAQLNFLHQTNIIDYQKSNDRPTIFLLQDRQKKDELLFDSEFLKKRMEVAVERVEKIKQYCLQKSVCRSKFIAAYFGEQESEDCGICDICLSQKKQQPVDYEKLFPKLTAILHEPMNIRTISDQLKLSISKTALLLEWAQSSGKVKINEEGKYCNA